MTDDKGAPDKLRQAEEWIATAPIGGEHWKAAWDHVRFLLGMEERYPVTSPDLRDKAQVIANKGLARAGQHLNKEVHP